MVDCFYVDVFEDSEEFEPLGVMTFQQAVELCGENGWNYFRTIWLGDVPGAAEE